MKIGMKIAVVAASVVTAAGAYSTAAGASTATPASGSSGTPVHTQTTFRGHTGCFNYSYNDGGSKSVTVYWHNTCKHHKHLKLRIANAKDGCAYPAGKTKAHHKFKSDNGKKPTVQVINAQACNPVNV
jgi:hypothetical protein